ncbi:MAG TPA: alpha/beta hydrolase [Candidatus Polarisedimenticolaceae bacterium]|nr:alpha/beta hydrolase [Candidatus Polarisedimenticolaceae bacterium]
MSCSKPIVALILAGLLVWNGSAALAQQTCKARMEQDPALNNLVHPEGYRPAESGTLGQVIRAGNGPLPLVLIAGAGFGGDVFAGFMEANRERYAMTAVSLPGFGGTPAPPMPAPGTSYSEQTWTRAAQDAVARLIEEQKLDRPIVLGHWLSGAQIAIGLAVERPDLVRAAVVVSGVPGFVGTAGSSLPAPKTPQQRAIFIDHSMAPNWFKTVTRATWDDNNFLPRDYAIHPLRGLQLWQEAWRPTLPTWIRYLCEVWAADSRQHLDRLEIPLLIVEPQLDPLFFEGPQKGDYMQAFLHQGWEGVEQQSPQIRVQTIADSRVFVMDDQPAKLNEAIAQFAQRVGAGMPRPRPAAIDRHSSLPGYWHGGVERRAERYLLRDAGISLERPAGDWELRAEADAPPIVARLADPQNKAQVTIQIQATFGLDLDAMVALIESRYGAQFANFRRISTAATRVDGRDARQLDCSYERNGAPEQARLIVARLADDFVLSLGFRAAPEEFSGFEAPFARTLSSLRWSSP